MNSTSLLELVTLLVSAQLNIERVRDENRSDLDGRSISIALMHLQTAQLWLANAQRDS